MLRTDVWKNVLVVTFFVIAYFIAGKIGLSMAFLHVSASPVWPPTGMAIAACLLWGYRIWPAIFLGAFLVNLTTAGTVATSIDIALGNTLEALLAAFLINKFASGYKVFERPRDIYKFLFLAGIISTMVSATIGVTSLALAGFAHWTAYGPIWFTWWLGDATGALVVTPFLVLWSNDRHIRLNRNQIIEALFILIALFATGAFIFLGFSSVSTDRLPVSFLTFPVLIWVASRFSQRETATTIILLSIIATWGTLHGFGPFARYSPNQSLLLLQAFMSSISILTLVLSASVFVRKHSQDELRDVQSRLEVLVKERTSSLEQKGYQLEEEKSKDEAILSSIGDSMIVVNQEGKITFINNQAEAVLNCKSSEVLGKDCAHAVPLEDQDGKLIPRHKRPYMQVLSTGKRFTTGVTPFYFRRGAARIPFAVTVTPIVLRDTIVGAVTILQDISSFKKAETIKEEQLRHEIGLERKERDFISMASHQLLTPLALIDGYLSMLLSGNYGKIDATAEDYLRQSLKSGHRMGKLIKDFLNIARLERGKIQFEKSVFSPSAVLEDVINDYTLKARAKGILLKLYKNSSIMVYADKNYTKEIAANLIDNAIKFTDKGSVDVSLEVEKNTFAKISIRDTGIGIKQNDLPHIFEKFHLSEEWVTSQGQSNGLGLYIARLLVEQMGGTINVESRSGVGSTFIFTLPLAKQDANRE